MEKSKLEKLRTRWLRWLGQKTRSDRDTWVELLDTNWSGWPYKVLKRAGLDFGYLTPASSQVDVYYTFQAAIYEATMEELKQLDKIYVDDLVSRGKL